VSFDGVSLPNLDCMEHGKMIYVSSRKCCAFRIGTLI
jgi:hypothetical protein